MAITVEILYSYAKLASIRIAINASEPLVPLSPARTPILLLAAIASSCRSIMKEYLVRGCLNKSLSTLSVKGTLSQVDNILSLDKDK